VQWAETELAEAGMEATPWDGTNFYLNWTTNDANAYVIHYLAIGGSDVSAKVLTWQMKTSTGDHPVTGTGFRPNLVLHAHIGDEFTAA
ncbi:MAG: hypothetical protein GTO63_33315, partial [Anaerolineae bacterium]|nr:hypothetical protein [Anaerolineae bacterium]NIN99529.1 hypothetical protein [Anaerolineae bacterium]NIQ82394.1 hypothetical protein [Anaerolineae bacterium]